MGANRCGARSTSQRYNPAGANLAPLSPNYELHTTAIYAQGQLNWLAEQVVLMPGARCDFITYRTLETELLIPFTPGQKNTPFFGPSLGAQVERLAGLQGYGFVRVFRFAAPDGGTEGAAYWASSDPELTEAQRVPLAALAWGIEQYHRGLKQCCGMEKAQVRAAKAQRNHVGYALRAFLRLEAHRLQTGRSWYEAKKQLLREAI